ncbi:phage antirepressor KilAC domain-containing protein [Tsukamurella ocularis]
MTRFAAYLIAMNGDPRKPEVAAAQAYFAIRTREAETRPALDVSEVTRRDLALAIIDAEDRADAAEAANKVLASRIEKDAPLVAKAEAHTVSDSVVHRQEFAREVMAWGVKAGLTIKQADVMRFLGHIGLFIRGERTDTGHATADAMKRGLAFTDKGTAKNGHAWATGKLTARGQDYAWKRIIAFAEANGTLELPRQLRGGDPA